MTNTNLLLKPSDTGIAAMLTKLQQNASKSKHWVDVTLAAAGLEPREVHDHGLRVRVLTIGPAEAKALLTLNTDNRKIRPGRVKYYARVMKQNGWVLTHQGIAFSEDGVGLDLQHRLLAVIESGVDIKVMVVEGLSKEAFAAIDQMERRSVADALKLRQDLTEEAKFLLLIAGGHNGTHPTIEDVRDASEAIMEYSDYLRDVAPTKRKVVSAVSMRVAAIMLMMASPLQSEKIAAIYRLFSLGRTEDYTPIMHAFNRQVADGKMNTSDMSGRIDLFRRALIVLDPDCAAMKTVRLHGDSLQDGWRVFAKTIIGLD
jgi:hypothetical protein